MKPKLGKFNWCYRRNVKSSSLIFLSLKTWNLSQDNQSGVWISFINTPLIFSAITDGLVTFEIFVRDYNPYLREFEEHIFLCNSFDTKVWLSLKCEYLKDRCKHKHKPDKLIPRSCSAKHRRLKKSGMFQWPKMLGMMETVNSFYPITVRYLLQFLPDIVEGCYVPFPLLVFLFYLCKYCRPS